MWLTDHSQATHRSHKRSEKSMGGDQTKRLLGFWRALVLMDGGFTRSLATPVCLNGAVRDRGNSEIHPFILVTQRKLLTPLLYRGHYPLYRGVDKWMGMCWARVVTNPQAHSKLEICWIQCIQRADSFRPELKQVFAIFAIMQQLFCQRRAPCLRRKVLEWTLRVNVWSTNVENPHAWIPL